MLRLSKETEYGIVLLRLFLVGAEPGVRSARDLATESSLPLPTVARILKRLAKHGILISHRGTHGGYEAAGDCRPPASPNASYHSSYYGDPAYDDYPVIFDNWFDADAFCQWRRGRLPSEAEWEKAAGFDAVEGVRTLYPWGDVFDGTRLNYCDKNCPREHRDGSVDDGHQDTAPVGSYLDGRSSLGIYDMSGNVMEWVGDWYDPQFYQGSTDTNPLGPVEGQFKSIRGGSWLSAADETTVTIRDSFDPLVARTNLGFRCAMTPP